MNKIWKNKAQIVTIELITDDKLSVKKVVRESTKGWFNPKTCRKELWYSEEDGRYVRNSVVETCYYDKVNNEIFEMPRIIITYNDGSTRSLSYPKNIYKNRETAIACANGKYERLVASCKEEQS